MFIKPEWLHTIILTICTAIFYAAELPKPVSLLSTPNVTFSGLSLLAEFSTAIPSHRKPHVHFLALIAYNKEAVAAATEVAIKEVQQLYAQNVTFTYSAFWNAHSFCDEFDSATTAYLADFYYVTRLSLEKSHLIILAIGI